MSTNIIFKPDQHEMSVDDVRAAVFAWEKDKAASGQKQIELRVEHIYSDGVYARVLHIPAGVELSGRIHLYENLNILSSGEMHVLTEKGMQHVKAGFHIVSAPGTKRIAKTITDCVWTTILKTDEKDPEKIEKLFTVNDEKEYLAFAGNLTIEGNKPCLS